MITPGSSSSFIRLVPTCFYGNSRPTSAGPNETVRIRYAREAAALLARIATDHNGPLVSDLATVEPTLALALSEAQTAPAIATALREIPDPDAQRSLADVVLDPSRAPQIRKKVHQS